MERIIQVHLSIGIKVQDAIVTQELTSLIVLFFNLVNMMVMDTLQQQNLIIAF